ncbi:UDP-N-acetylglucosamine-N-acetylmuramylpentapeptide N-acetylglucosamine transferase [Lachnospiraceae bacterium XBB1006]|nr:UDP-N-acetylglucosamine-N-acetylmuramylpentapeptide N-acetylglucosamine transferase [Lachnospiraceae bacterium XBB1006]
MKKIILTGGGTAGHVTPNIALLPLLKERGFDITYVGSYEGIEKTLATEAGLTYYGISSGKLRRYFDWKNFTDPFRVLKGYKQAKRLMKKEKPNVVFSKGGFVSVPIVMAAKRLGIPAVIHESDLTPGLANKLAIPHASKVCCNFPETMKYLPEGKSLLTGSPIRQELLHGDAEKGKAFCGLTHEKPILLVIGGSIGSIAINNAIRGILPELLTQFEVIHICGAGNLSKEHVGVAGYCQYEYVREELADLFALADIVVSRAGANTICELLALKMPSILIPLPASASRGDQILNANSFEKQGFAMKVDQDTMTEKSLLAAIKDLYANREKYRDAMNASKQLDSVKTIVDLLDELAR